MHRRRGCDTFDKTEIIQKWAEGGTAPERIVDSKKAAGNVIRTSPLSNDPTVAKFKGSEDTEDEVNFVCTNEAAGGTRRLDALYLGDYLTGTQITMHSKPAPGEGWRFH